MRLFVGVPWWIAIWLWMIWFAVTCFLTLCGIAILAVAGVVWLVGAGMGACSEGKGAGLKQAGAGVFQGAVRMIDRMNGHATR
jgi:hypothetical protein